MNKCLTHDFPKLIRDSGFGFDTVKPNASIDWNDIRVIDIDRLISERDFRTLDGHIPEVINCQLESEFNVQILDNGFVKLFRLSQLSVEYLLQCRRHLDLLTMALKSEIRELTQEMEFLKKQLNDKENEIMKMQMKFKRRKKNFVKSSEQNELANIFKHLTSNASNYEMLTKSDEGLLTNKCIHCNKIFLNRYYLDCHILRRHPKSVENEGNVATNVESQRNASLAERLEDKIFLEFEHLKERLSTTEKLFRSIENIDLSSSQKKITEMDNIENLSSIHKREYKEGKLSIKEDTENEESKKDTMDKQKWTLEKIAKQNLENEKSKKSLINKQIQEPKESVKPAEKDKGSEEQQKDVIEKLQKIINEDQKQNSSQIEELKKQLLQNINSIKEKLYLLEENNKQSEDKQKLIEITTNIKKQADDINILKNTLQEKLSSSIEEFKYTIGNQEQLWDKKFKTLEIQHIHTIEDLKSNVLTYLKECQKMQQQYVEKIDSLENKAVQHTKVSEVQKNTQIRDAEFSNENNIMFHLQTNNMKNMIEDEVNNETDRKTNNSGIEKNKNKTQIKEVIPNRKYKLDVDNSSDEKSSFSEELTTDLKITPSSKNNKKLNRKLGFTHPMKLSENIVTSTPVKRNAINGVLYKHKLVNEKIDKQIESEDSESLSSSIMSEQNSPNIATSNAERVDGKIIADDNIESAEKLLMRKPNVFKAIRNDLNLMLNARLKNMGILADSKMISSGMYTSCNQTIQNRRLLLKKEYKDYDGIRKGLLKMLHNKVKSLKLNKKASKTAETESKKGSRNTNLLKPDSNSPKIKNSMNSPKTKITAKNQKKSPKILNELNHKIPMSKKSSVNIFNNENEQTKNKVFIPESNKNTTYSISDIESSVTNYSDTESSDTMKKTSKSELTKKIDFNIEVEDLLKSPLKKPFKNDAGEEILQHSNDFNKSSFITDTKKSQNIEGRFSKSETNILQSSDSFSSNSIKLDDSPKKITNNLVRKTVSEDNLNGNTRNISTKGVLKNVTSSGSLTKKRVNFDLGSNKIKSLSTEDIMNLHLENPNYENSLKIIAVSDNDIHINKPSRVSEIATLLEAQTSFRNITNPPVGGINLLPHTKNMDAKSNQSETVKTLKTDQTNPTKYTESDIELSDWSDDYSFGTKYN